MEQVEQVRSGYINISITETDISYDSDFDIRDIVFWLNLTQAMLIKNLLETGEG